MTKEKNFEKRIRKYLDSIGAWSLKYWAGGQFTVSGIPDILACIRGRFAGIEVKADDGEPSELQIWTANRIRQAGGVSVILYPSAFEEFKAWVAGGFAGEKPVIMK